ncbi:hypothetical protein R3X28_19075, partial [Maribacter sp. TH_r10]|uniref:hypothetical protein n=1 Tax=Maribacter sp. TH_r10 TaxID=3082086 RepID=UPI0029532ED0
IALISTSFLFCIAKKRNRAEKLRYNIPWFKGASRSMASLLRSTLRKANKNHCHSVQAAFTSVKCSMDAFPLPMCKSLDLLRN